jgi:hypothetical protein
VIIMPNPLVSVRSNITNVVSNWRSRSGDPYADAFRWVRENTARNAVIITSPERRNARWIAERALYVGLGPAYQDVGGWIDRMNALMGDDYRGTDVMELRTNALFEQRTREQLAAARETFGGDVLVAESCRGWPELFRSGGVRVCALAPDAPP